MSVYTFNFKKGDLEIYFQTSDSKLIASQTEKWAEALASIPDTVVEAKKPEDKKQKQIPEPVIKEEISEEVIFAEENEVEPVEDISVEEETTEIQAVVKNQEPEPEQEVKPVEPEIVKAEKEEVKPLHVEEAERAFKANQKFQAPEHNEFFEVLQEKFNSIPEIVNEKTVQGNTEISNKAPKFATLEDLLNLKKHDTLLDFLIITAYYLRAIELTDRFSLKQLNSKAMSLAKKPIDHSIIQEAVKKEYLEIIPDYTGMADVTEYKLTPEGESYLLNEL